MKWCSILLSMLSRTPARRCQYFTKQLLEGIYGLQLSRCVPEMQSSYILHLKEVHIKLP